jgi:hypothetical protein
MAARSLAQPLPKVGDPANARTPCPNHLVLGAGEVAGTLSTACSGSMAPPPWWSSPSTASPAAIASITTDPKLSCNGQKARPTKGILASSWILGRSLFHHLALLPSRPDTLGILGRYYAAPALRLSGAFWSGGRPLSHVAYHCFGIPIILLRLCANY